MSPTRKRLLIPACAVLVAGVGLAAFAVVLARRDDPDLAAAREAAGRRDFAEASRLLEGYTAAHPKDTATHLFAAQVARRQQDYPAASRHLEAYQKLNGPEEPVRAEYRLLVVQQGELSEVDQLFATCEARPDAPEMPLVLEAVIVGCLTVLAPPLAPLTPFDLEAIPPPLTLARKATELWVRTRTGTADQAQGLVWRGRVRCMGGEYFAGQADLRRALELAPDHFEARAYIALSIGQEAPAEAVAHLENLTRRFPDQFRLRFALATARHGMGDLDEARRLLEELSKQYPNEISLIVELALVALDQNRTDEAEQLLLRAETMAPTLSLIQNALSRCTHLQGRADEAKRRQARFLELEAEQKRQLQAPRRPPPRP